MRKVSPSYPWLLFSLRLPLILYPVGGRRVFPLVSHTGFHIKAKVRQP